MDSPLVLDFRAGALASVADNAHSFLYYSD